MRGEVISVDGLSGDGLISGADGARYAFTAASTRASLQAGDRVDFVPLESTATEIMVMASSARAGPAPARIYRPYDEAYNFGWAMFAFDGRLRRSHFWISWLILVGVGFVTGFIPFFNFIMFLALIWPHVAIGAKRLHDMGRSGWLIAIPWGFMVGSVILAALSFSFAAFDNPDAFESDDPTAAFSTLGSSMLILVAMLVGIGFWLWIGIADSQPGRNKHGRNPKNPHQDDAEIFA